MMLRTAIVFAAVSVAVASLVGCGKSKEDIALERIANRKGPGFVRLYNLTDETIGLGWSNMEYDSTIAPGTVSNFRNVGSGDQEVRITSGGSVLATVPMKIATQELYTVAVFGGPGNIRTTVITDEQLKPSATKNLQAFFIDEAGKKFSGTVEVTNGTDTYKLTDSSGGILANTGAYSVKGSGLASATGATIESDGAYSVLVVKESDGSTHAVLVRNTSSDKPMAGGMAQG